MVKEIIHVGLTVSNIELPIAFYVHLRKHNVLCLSGPQFFDCSAYGFGKSKALYFRDPDGLILEAMQTL